MNNKRLSLADFKAKAENVNTNEVLEKIQGGEMDDCHNTTNLIKIGAEYLAWWIEVLD
ncbi:hypothetical protein [Tenacibaculum maritimum]|uniref:hypothetical protein n=1 Tax=Tenacibaculum maritimum TaxID=107401 RepID=UPI000414637E|nr:hypothetical protein [Tenacibaculum maritimum]